MAALPESDSGFKLRLRSESRLTAAAIASLNSVTSTIVNRRSWSHLGLMCQVERIRGRHFHVYFGGGFGRDVSGDSDVD